MTNITGSYYINLNARTLTTDIRNTEAKDKKALEFMSDQLNPVEDIVKALKIPINLADSISINKAENSVNIAAGMKINVRAGYVLTVKPQGVEVSGGDPYDQEAWEEVQNMATTLGTLLRNAGGTMNTVAYNASEYQRWTDNVAKTMKYLGIDTTKEFTINGTRYSKNENGYFESEMTVEAKMAYERLKANNMTYEFADEKTKKRIEHISRYYLADAPEEIMEEWERTLEETGINPFAEGYASSLIQLATEQDIKIGGNDRIFGDSIESVLNEIERILERIENPLAEVDLDRLDVEKTFYSKWKENIMQKQ